MEVFVARQPIFNRNEEVVSYELLYRNNQINEFPNIDGDQATADVIINSFLNIGIENLSAGLPCFINFTENLLKKKIPIYFHPRDIVVEILENVSPSPELIMICRELKDQGYQIALDDYVFQESNPYSLELLKYIDIVKIDFLTTVDHARRKIESIVKPYKIQLLAEKVETREEFELARNRGYHLFQGYFFSKPVIMSTYDIPTSFNSYHQIINSLSTENISIDVITQIIEQDLSLSYKLLKLINSPAYRPKHKIHSIRQAIVLLGLIEIKRWIYVLAVRENSGVLQQLSDEVVKVCLTRAKMCELIAEKKYGKFKAASYFLLGMFSLMDTILAVPMEQILKKLSLNDDLYSALCGTQNEMRDILDLSIAIERAEWIKIDSYLSGTYMEEKELFNIYQNAFQWSEQVLKAEISTDTL